MGYHPPFEVVYTSPTGGKEAFPGLIPGLAGGLPGHPVSVPIKTSEPLNALVVASEPDRFPSWEKLEPGILENASEVFAERMAGLRKAHDEISGDKRRLKAEAWAVYQEHKPHERRIREQKSRDFDDLKEWVRNRPPEPPGGRLKVLVARLESGMVLRKDGTADSK